MNNKTILLLVVLGFVIGVIIMTPYGLGHPTSDSMEPTLSQDDIYVLVPAINLGEGDVIVFSQSQTENGIQQLTVHRIVEKTNQGYITQGDANERTDQEVGFPPVTEKQVKGKLLVVGDQPVTIPSSYQVTEMITQNSRLIAVFGLLLIVFQLLKDKVSSRVSKRNPTRPVETREILTVTPLLIFICLVLFLYLTPTVHVWTVVAANDDIARESQTNVPLNEQVEQEMVFNYTQNEFGIAFPDLQGGTIQSVDYQTETIHIQTTLGPYHSKGEKEARVIFHRYPVVLPSDWIQTLHSIHPFVASVSVSSIVVFPLWVLLYLLLPNSPVRIANKQKIGLFR